VSAGARNVLPRLLARLIDAGIEEDLVRDVGDELKSIMIREQITQEELLNLQLARVLMSRFRAARPLGERLRIPTTPRVIVFVGPTGVGKTTTIAKIAAELVIHQRRPVTLATTDTYKIAAVEQLQTYANILKVPLEVCPTAEALAELGSRVGSEEVVLVDTAGFGPRDEKKVHELQDVLSGVRCETHLCVSATTRDRDLRDMARRFAVFKPDYLVVTKTDETTAYGNVYNIAVRSHYPLSYFTMGQRVPEDIEIATKERVADLLLNITGEN
jgi:flagellar biosynthesis protein FlhF